MALAAGFGVPNRQLGPTAPQPQFNGPMGGLQQAAPPTLSHIAANSGNPTGKQTTINPANGAQGPDVAATPYAQTNQFQTTPGAVGGPHGGAGNTAVSGQGALAQPSYEQQQQTQLESQLAQQGTAQRADLSSKAFQERLAAFSAQDAGNGGAGGVAPVQYDMAGSQGARDAILARAKDAAGKNARAGSDALSGLMSERGMVGGGAQAFGNANIVGNAQGAIGDVNREMMIQELGRQGQIGDMTYQGNIAQRGQTLQSQAARRQSLISLMNSGQGLF